MHKDFISRLKWTARAQKPVFQVLAVVTKLQVTNSTDTR